MSIRMKTGVARRLRLRERFAICAAVVLGGGVLAAGTATPASASQQEADRVLAEVRDATPVGAPTLTAEPIPLSESRDGFSGASQRMSFLIDESSEVDLLTVGDATLSISIPDAVSQSATLASDSMGIVYGSVAGEAAYAVQAFADGVQLSVLVENSTSPRRFDFGVAVPSGGGLELLDDGGVAVSDGEGGTVGYLSPPWARDASGNPVPTQYTVEGNTVTQEVLHTGQQYDYPIVADPYLFKDLIKSRDWEWKDRSRGGAIGAGWTMEVTPTAWARGWGAGSQAVGGVIVGSALSYHIGTKGWDEIMDKFPNGIRNHGAMRDQWICHQQFVSIRKPKAETWNLDIWRKDVSYASTVRYQCNPPRGGDYVYD